MRFKESKRERSEEVESLCVNGRSGYTGFPMILMNFSSPVTLYRSAPHPLYL